MARSQKDVSKFKPIDGSSTVERRPSAALTRKPPRIKPANALETDIVQSSVDFPATPTTPVETGYGTSNYNPARQFALKCTLLFLYFRFSFLHEFISSAIHIDTHLLIILGSVCYLAWFVAGDLFAAYSERLAWVWTAFVVWLCLATATSTWKGGSFALILPYVRTIFPLLLLIPSVVTSTTDFKKVMNVLGWAGTTTVLFGLAHRNFNQGRLDIGTDDSTVQDPNDFAAQIIMMLPAIAYVMFNKERSIFVKVFGAGIVAAALLEILSTGSRGGMVALAIMVVYLVFTGSTKIRLAILVGLPLAGLAALPLVPKQSISRIVSLVNSSQASESAAESSEARRALLMESLKATAQHPLFGVGPGTFQIYQAGMAAERHQKGMWHETHNGYTEISSESGVPAAILYFVALYMMFKSFRRASKLNIPVIPVAARTLATMTVGFSSTLIFLAQCYRFSMLVMAAFTIAMNRIIKQYEPLPTGA